MVHIYISYTTIIIWGYNILVDDLSGVRDAVAKRDRWVSRKRVDPPTRSHFWKWSDFDDRGDDDVYTFWMLKVTRLPC